MVILKREKRNSDISNHNHHVEDRSTIINAVGQNNFQIFSRA